MTWTKHDSFSIQDCFERFEYKGGRLFYKMDICSKAKAGQEAGSTCRNGYKSVMINQKRTLVHRIIFLMHYGYLPKIVDHINGIKDDNRIENLRESDYSMNGFSHREMKNGSSKYRGVSYIKRDKRYQAKIKIKGKCYNLGYYKNEEDAARAYDKKALEVAGNHAQLNFPK